MSCTPPLLLQHAVEKIENINHSILTYCMMKCLRAGPYNGKTTLNCQYRIIHEKKGGEIITKSGIMSYEACDVMLRNVP